MRAKEPIFGTVEYFSLSAIDQTCMAYVKQILFSLHKSLPANTEAVRHQVAGTGNWILPHRWLQELSAPIQAYIKAEVD